jgi:hypothetical protein
LKASLYLATNNHRGTERRQTMIILKNVETPASTEVKTGDHMQGGPR